MKKKPVSPDAKWLAVEARADHVRMSISGPIGASIFDDTGTNSKEFCDALEAVDADTPIHLHVNSEGGSVSQALEIYNSLKARGGVKGFNDGVSLSAASLVLVGCDTVVSPQSSVWMIHSPRVGTFGDSEEHKKSLKMLDTFRSTMADVYAEETGQSKKDILAMMDSESWFTGLEAIDFGLADTEDDADEDYTNAYTDRAKAVMAMYRPPENIRELLKTSGASAASATTQKTMKETTQNPPAAAATTATASTTNDNLDMKRFVEERKARITAKVKELAEGRIKNDRLQWWIDAAVNANDMAAEQAVYDQIEAMPMAAAAEGQPVGRDAALSNDETPVAYGANVTGNVGTCYSRQVDSRGRIVEIGVSPDRMRTPFAQGLRRLKTSWERVQAMKREWSGLLSHAIELDEKQIKAGRMSPVAANNYSQTLITDYLVDQSLTILTNTWAALSCFTRDFSIDRYKSLATGQIKFVTAGATTLVGTKSSQITNFEQGDSTTYPVSVPMTHYSQPFHVTQDELMSGLRLENLMNINLAVLANTILRAALQPIASGALNSGGATVAFSAGTYFASSSAGTFGWSTDMPRLRSYLKKSPLKNAVLDGSFYSYLVNQPGFFQPTMTGSRGDRAVTFGWDQLQENTVWPATTNTIGGFVCNPQAIGVVAGLPQTPPQAPTGSVLLETIIFVPGPDISVAAYTWFSTSTRTLWSSYDLVFGAAGGDASAGAVLYDGAGPRS